MTEEELRVLAWTLLGEAAGEGAPGMEAVAHVIRNRALSGRYPSNPAAVALQNNGSGYYQFSTWNPPAQGGNLPRSRYNPSTSIFNEALSIVQKVFGPIPGKDPTQGATHYYAHNTMSAPYWWSNEAKHGEKRIGNHTYATRYDYPEAPTPAERSMTSSLGYFPVDAELTVFRSGMPIQLKPIGPDQRVPTPATQSLQLQVQRENAGASVRSIDTFVLDPVTGQLRNVTNKQALGQERTNKTAKQIQDEAKLRANQSYAGQDSQRIQQQIADKEMVEAVRRAYLMTTQSYVGQDTARSATTSVKLAQDGKKLQQQEQAAERRRQQAAGKQTQFAQPVAQPAGSINPNKGEDRLAPGSAVIELAPGKAANPYSRDAVLRKSAGATLAAELFGGVNVAPVQPKVLQEQVVKQVTPKPAEETGGGARIVIDNPNIVRVIQSEPRVATNGYVYQDGKQIGTTRPAGMTAAEQYDAINRAAEAAARERAGMGPDTRSDWFKEVTGG